MEKIQNVGIKSAFTPLFYPGRQMFMSLKASQILWGAKCQTQDLISIIHPSCKTYVYIIYLLFLPIIFICVITLLLDLYAVHFFFCLITKVNCWNISNNLKAVFNILSKLLKFLMLTNQGNLWSGANFQKQYFLWIIKQTDIKHKSQTKLDLSINLWYHDLCMGLMNKEWDGLHTGGAVIMGFYSQLESVLIVGYISTFYFCD